MIKKLKQSHTSTVRTWKCYRCNLIFQEESMASLQREKSNHTAMQVDRDYGNFKLLTERQGLIADTIAN